MSNIFDRDGEVKVFNGPKFTDKFLNAKINAEIERATNAEEEIRRLIVSGFIENIDGIIVLQNTSADISKYENNQLFFVTSEYKFYKKQNNSLVLYYDLNEYRNKIGIIALDVAFEDATLTTAQLSEVDKDFVVIIDSNNKAFIKDDSDSEYAIFFALDNITIDNNVNNMYTRLTKDCFKVDLSSGDVIAVSNYYDVTKDIYTFKQVGVLDTSELVINYINKYGSHFEFSVDTYRQKRFFFTSGHRLFQNNYFGVAVFNESGIRYSGNTESIMDLTSLTLGTLMSDTYRNDFITQKDTQTIPGSKTFSSVPQATSAPVNDNDLSRKSYVDTQDANKLTEAKSYSDANLVTAKSYTDSQKADLKSYVDNNYVNNSEKGTANGVASLDSSGQIPLSQIPVSVTGQTEYCGKWDASSNVSQLTDDHSLRKGDYYICQTSGQYNPEGTKDSPVNDYVVGDWAIYNGDTWDMIDNTDAVYSVNNKTGAVVLDKTDIGLGNVDNTSDLNKPISTATQNALDLKLSKTEAGDVYQAKILHADITYIATSDWQQVVPVDAEPYYEWKNAETTDLYSILGVVNSDDLADLRGIDATTRAEMGEAGIYLYNVTTTNGHTYAYIRSKFQPSTVLNLTVTVTKQYANGGSVSDLLTTGDITGSDTIEFSNSKVEVKSSLVDTWNNKQDALTFDNAPTANSNNPVTSGGVYNALNNKQDNLTSSSVTRGTIAEVIGFDSSNNLIKGTVSSGLEFVEINASLSESEVTIEITQEQYQKLLGDNVVLKINDSENDGENGSFYMYKTNDVTEPNMAIYSNIITNFSINAVVEQVEIVNPNEVDLTETTWILNSPFNWRINNDVVFNVDFESNGNYYDSIDISLGRETVRYYSGLRYIDAVDNIGMFSSQELRTIYITGGSDSLSDTFYNWLTANATQVNPEESEEPEYAIVITSQELGGGLPEVTINVDINDSSSYSGTLSSADYTTLAGDNAYIKINFQDTGVTQYSATLYKKQDLSGIGMPIVYEMSVTTSASVSGVSITIATDGTREYSIEENIYTPEGVSYLTTAPSANNTDGDLKFVILSSEPATYYDGYLYIVTGGNQ